jgi:hypothetical protein
VAKALSARSLPSLSEVGSHVQRHIDSLAGDKVALPEGATDAFLTPYDVARSRLFVRERSAKTLVRLDTAAIEANKMRFRGRVAPQHS